MVSGPTRSMVTVSVEWMDEDQINDVCKRSYRVNGCAIAGSPCRMYVTEPKDFNDRDALVVLGHEFFHCLGAQHRD